MTDVSNDLISKTEEAKEGTGSFKDIKVVEGTFKSAIRVPPNPKFAENSKYKDKQGNPKIPNDQVEITLTDAVVVETESGEIPDLKDSTYKFWINYAPKDKLEPNKSSFFVKGFMASAETLFKTKGQEGKGFKDLIGEHVRLARQVVELYKYKENKDDKDEKPFTAEGFVFVDAPTEDITDYAIGKIVGKTLAAGLRELMIDPKTKKDDKLIAAARAGKLTDFLPGVTVVKGVYKVG